MSGKFANKKSRKRSGKAQDRRLLVAIGVLSVVLAALLALLFWLESGPAHTQPEQTDGTEQTTQPEPETTAQPETTAPAETESQTQLSTEPGTQGLFDLGSGVLVTDYIAYTGAFMEDRTDEVVTDVLAIQVTNTGEKYIQTMDITLVAGDTQAEFSLSTLFPGETVIVLEKNRMAYSTAPEFERAEASSVALFDGHPGMCEDKLKIQCLDGVINITNISDEDISGDILIYYKNYIGGKYYGGITYRIRVTGGLKAGQIHQGTAAHFNPDNSTVVFVTCG